MAAATAVAAIAEGLATVAVSPEHVRRDTVARITAVRAATALLTGGD